MKTIVSLLIAFTLTGCFGAEDPEPQDECRHRAPSSAGRWANYCLDPDPDWCVAEQERTGELPAGCE